MTSNKVDLFVNKKPVLSGATLKANGNMLEVTGKVKKGFGGIILPGFALEEMVTEGITPKDPADFASAMALVE